MNYVSNIKKAIHWLDENSTNDYVFVSNKERIPYPEVTGYFIPTLKRFGFHKKAKGFADYLVSIQNKNGSWEFKGKGYIFDTAQIVDGLLEYPEYKENAEKGVAWILSQIQENKFKELSLSRFPEQIYLRVLWVLQKVGYDISSLKEYYLRTIRFDCLSHWYGYAFEGCARMGLDCRQFLNFSEKNYQKIEGKSSYCFTGLSQMALSLFLLGKYNLGMKIIDFVTKHQTNSGGFVGSTGSYLPQEEISWAVKFYLDAFNESIKLYFNSWIPSNNFEEGDKDEKLIFIKNRISKTDKVLDAGTGKGRYINNLDCERYACDLALDSKYLNNVIYKQGSCLWLPFENDFFDKVICCEALEHTVFHNNAIDEMLRVIKPNGKLLIIDKKDIPIESLACCERMPDYEQLIEKYNAKVNNIKGSWCYKFLGVEIKKL